MNLEFKRLSEVDPAEIISLNTDPLVLRHMPLGKGDFDHARCREWVKEKDAQWALHGYMPGYTPKVSSKWHRRRCRPRNASHWRLPNASVYRVACQIGYECGAHFAQYLKDQPDWSCYGVLRRILADIDFKDSSPNKGYTVGFIYYMERLVRFAAMDIDVFADVDQTNAYYDDMEARTALEEAAEIGSK